MLSQAAAVSPLRLGKCWSAAWRTWAEISFGSRGIFEWFWLFEDPGILNSQLSGFLRKTKVCSSPRTFYIQITFLFSEWIVNENGFTLEHFLLFIPNVWPFIIPRGVQLSTSLSTHMHACTHTHTSYLILFSSPLLSGVQCEECSAGFYGNPRISRAPCRPCACNNNIDVTDPGSCSPVTGECLKCLYNTQGPNCQLCKPGYFGSALNQTCTSKSAKLLAGNVAAWTVVATPVLI